MTTKKSLTCHKVGTKISRSDKQLGYQRRGNPLLTRALSVWGASDFRTELEIYYTIRSQQKTASHLLLITYMGQHNGSGRRMFRIKNKEARNEW